MVEYSEVGLFNAACRTVCQCSLLGVFHWLAIQLDDVQKCSDTHLDMIYTKVGSLLCRSKRMVDFWSPLRSDAAEV
jgi:hypothetical protein